MQYSTPSDFRAISKVAHQEEDCITWNTKGPRWLDISLVTSTWWMLCSLPKATDREQSALNIKVLTIRTKEAVVQKFVAANSVARENATQDLLANLVVACQKCRQSGAHLRRWHRACSMPPTFLGFIAILYADSTKASIAAITVLVVHLHVVNIAEPVFVTTLLLLVLPFEQGSKCRNVARTNIQRHAGPAWKLLVCSRKRPLRRPQLHPDRPQHQPLSYTRQHRPLSYTLHHQPFPGTQQRLR
mmetsp:Transcript_83191/g.131280  ORF Transcript_83191/g.131280 Transcript_83191/m.131280 type:complete len:244 (+) Transcript_83191:171-902(+)